MKDDPTRKPETAVGVSRRDFMKISGVGVAVPLVLGPKVVEAAGEEVAVYGPGQSADRADRQWEEADAPSWSHGSHCWMPCATTSTSPALSASATVASAELARC